MGEPARQTDGYKTEQAQKRREKDPYYKHGSNPSTQQASKQSVYKSPHEPKKKKQRLYPPFPPPPHPTSLRFSQYVENSFSQLRPAASHPLSRRTKSPSLYAAGYAFMMFCGTSASFVRIVGCHWTMCSCLGVSTGRMGGQSERREREIHTRACCSAFLKL